MDKVTRERQVPCGTDLARIMTDELAEVLLRESLVSGEDEGQGAGVVPAGLLIKGWSFPSADVFAGNAETMLTVRFLQ